MPIVAQLATLPLASICPSKPRIHRRALVVRAAQSDSSRGGRDNETSHTSSRPAGANPVPLPTGALWWQNLHTNITPLYGDNFVVQRPTVGGPGLIKSQRPPAPMRRPALAPAMPPVVWQAPGAGSGLGLTLAGGSLGSGAVVIDTHFTVLPPAGRTQQSQRLLPGAVGAAAATGAAQAEVQPNTSCVGIVWQGSVDEDAGTAFARRRGSRRHPRRTQMLRFTCNLCGEVNDCEVNPHAWAKGSVFARCQGCTAVHKLKDNLRIFHELAGPVFPPRELRSTYLVQEILDRIQENNRN